VVGAISSEGFKVVMLSQRLAEGYKLISNNQNDYLMHTSAGKYEGQNFLAMTFCRRS